MADLVSYALTNVADVKETLGIDAGNTSKDNLITRKINQATEVIEGFCKLHRNHHFAETTYTQEEYDGTTSNQLILRMRPVTTLDSFQYRDSTVNDDNWTDVDSDLYFIDNDAGVIDLLFTQTGHWNRYRATYTAGYSTIPADLSEAAVTMAAFLTDNAQTGVGVKSKREGRREIEYFEPQGGDSLIKQLSLDDQLERYVMRSYLADV